MKLTRRGLFKLVTGAVAAAVVGREVPQDVVSAPYSHVEGTPPTSATMTYTTANATEWYVMTGGFLVQLDRHGEWVPL
jgi:hypothetical protein